jgi:thioredoxin-related protein
MRISLKTRRSLEISANLAILVVAIIIVGNFLWARSKPKQDLQSPKVGTKVSVPGIKWDDGTTLVLVLQKGCRYCEESAAFYRRLHDQRSGSQPRMLAVVPGDKTEVARYLSEQGVVVDEIVNASLSVVKVSATPTLLLIDRAGIVTSVWVGKLDSSQETEVAQRMFSSH